MCVDKINRLYSLIRVINICYGPLLLKTIHPQFKLKNMGTLIGSTFLQLILKYFKIVIFTHL